MLKLMPILSLLPNDNILYPSSPSLENPLSSEQSEEDSKRKSYNIEVASTVASSMP
jgi:hypothetical protein